MSASRSVNFLVISVMIHAFVAVTIFYLAKPDPEKVYENIEVYSFVTPKSKSGVTQARPEKPKSENIKLAKTSSQESTDSETDTDQGSTEKIASEQLASDAEITTPAKLLTLTKANRTEAARKADYSGVSQVELVIGSDGLVKKVKLRNSLPHGLDDVALRLVQDSKFKPALINNKAVASSILFKVRFESE